MVRLDGRCGFCHNRLRSFELLHPEKSSDRGGRMASGMNNACPSCGSVYNVTAAHVGRTFTCKKCNVNLIVGVSGLEISGGLGVVPQMPSAPAAPAMPAGAEDAGYQPRPPRGKGKGAEVFSAFLNRVKEDVPAWLFGTGLVLIFLFLFFPLIDKAKDARKAAEVQRQDQVFSIKREALQTRRARLSNRQGRLQNRKFALANKQGDEKTKEEEAIKKEEEAIKAEDEAIRKDDDALSNEEDTWKKKKVDLDIEVSNARAATMRAHWFYRWGLLIGFLLVAFACFGFLKSDLPYRRSMGLIVMIGMLLMIFLFVVLAASNTGVGFFIGPQGGGRGPLD